MFTNLTAHEYNRYDSNGNLVQTVPPSGMVARIINTRIVVDNTLDVPTVKLIPQSIELISRDAMLKRVENPETTPFPAPQQNTFFIVSDQVANALAGTRSDLRVPDTDAAVLDPNGRIIGVPGFITK